MMNRMLRGYTKEEQGWIMYDWAYSAFATIMLAAIFPIFFVEFAGGDGTSGSMWWAIGNGGSRLLLAIAAPLIGAMIDYKGYKKRLFVLFLTFGILAHFFLAAQSSWQFLLVGYIIANIFWSASIFIYDSYLPDITTPDRMDEVSAAAYGWGYIGGSTIPFVFSILLIFYGENFGIDETLAVRISIVITAVWWGVFSIPMIRDVHHKYGTEAPQRDFVKETVGNAIRAAKKIVKNKALLFFILAYFFYIDGVGTVITMATAYGAELNLPATGMIAALFMTQIVAFPCSILFGKWSKKTNPLNLVLGAIVVYCFICVIGFFMGFGLEMFWFGTDEALILFFVLAILVGTVQGGIQALSRSIYGRLIPPEQSGEYFGFFEVFSRFAAILGPFLYALVLSTTGRASFSILSTVIIFFIGLTILLIGRKHIAPELRG